MQLAVIAGIIVNNVSIITL